MLPRESRPCSPPVRFGLSTQSSQTAGSRRGQQRSRSTEIQRLPEPQLGTDGLSASCCCWWCRLCWESIFDVALARAAVLCHNLENATPQPLPCDFWCTRNKCSPPRVFPAPGLLRFGLVTFCYGPPACRTYLLHHTPLTPSHPPNPLPVPSRTCFRTRNSGAEVSRVIRQPTPTPTPTTTATHILTTATTTTTTRIPGPTLHLLPAAPAMRRTVTRGKKGWGCWRGSCRPWTRAGVGAGTAAVGVCVTTGGGSARRYKRDGSWFQSACSGGRKGRHCV